MTFGRSNGFMQTSILQFRYPGGVSTPGIVVGCHCNFVLSSVVVVVDFGPASRISILRWTLCEQRLQFVAKSGCKPNWKGRTRMNSESSAR